MTHVCFVLWVAIMLMAIGVNKVSRRIRAWLADNENLITVLDSIGHQDYGYGLHTGFFCTEIDSNAVDVIMGGFSINIVDSIIEIESDDFLIGGEET